MFKIDFTRQYLRDLKLIRKRQLDESKLNRVIEMLISGHSLPFQYKDHLLNANYRGYRECHIAPDWLLIYSKNVSESLITLVRTGSHSDLF